MMQRDCHKEIEEHLFGEITRREAQALAITLYLYCAFVRPPSILLRYPAVCPPERN